MIKFNLEIEGVNKLLKDFERIGKEAVKVADSVTKATAADIAADAARLAPKDTGKLAQSISSQKIGHLSYRIFSDSKYAPYQEFGTGGLVSVPKGLEALAIQFKGKGKRKINMAAQPFLYPAVVINRLYYKQDLDTALNRILKK